jgi:Tol biopolymer transport system component
MPSPDGRYLLFTSGNEGDEKIYWVSMRVVDARRFTTER